MPQAGGSAVARRVEVNMLKFIHSFSAQDGGRMTDYFSEAEKLLKPQQVPEGFAQLGRAQAGMKTLPADQVAAQVLATLAVAEQLGRVATALERLAGGQEGAGPR